MMNIGHLEKLYGFKEQSKHDIHPIYEKHLEKSWVIHVIYQHFEQGNISKSKMRELITMVIEKACMEELESIIPEEISVPVTN